MSGKKKILWVGHFAPYPPKGGAMQRAFNMLKECSKYFDIDFVALSPRSKVLSYYSDYETGKSDIRSGLAPFCKEITLIDFGVKGRKLNKYTIAFKSLFSSKPYDVLALKSDELSDRVQKKMAKNEYDMVYVDTIGLCPLLPTTDKAIAMNHHNIESQMLFRRAEMASFPVSLYIKAQAKKTEQLEQAYCPKFQVNLTCSELDSERLQEIAPCSVESIPNGVDISYFHRSSDYAFDQTSDAIFAGGLDWYPNASAIDFILSDVMPGLSKNDIDVTIYGKGSHKNLEVEAQKPGSKISKGGFVDDIRDPMESARMYLCPISDGGGTKLKVLDALAMGIPLIAHPIACEGIDVEPGTHVLFAETKDEYLSAIRTLNSSADICERMSKASIELIKSKYAYDSIGQKIKTTFETAIDGNRK